MPGSIVAPVVGAVAGKVLGGDEPEAQGSGVSQQRMEVVVPEFLKGTADKFASLANTYANTGYTPYTGQRYADFTPDQLAAFSGIRNLQSGLGSIYDEATGINREVADLARQGFVTPESIQQFINPYQQGVIDITKREALKDFQGTLNNIGDMASQVGGFGGDRMGVLESNAYKDLLQNLSDVQTTGMQQAYDRAVSTSLQNNLSKAQTLGQSSSNLANLASQGLNSQLAGLSALQQIGGQQQAQAQLPLDFAYQQFAEEKNYIPSQLGTLSNAMAPFLGSSSTGTNTAYGPAPSGLQNMLGGAAIGQALGGAFKNSNFGRDVFGNFSVGNIFSSNPINNTFDTALGSFNSLGNFGFKEGGMVKKEHCYAEGGSVGERIGLQNLLFRKDPELPYGPNQPNKLLELLKDFYSVPMDRANELKSEAEAKEKDTENLRSAIRDTSERHAIENTILANQKPEEFAHITMTPEQKSALAVKRKINAIAKDLGVNVFDETNSSQAPAEEGPMGPPTRQPEQTPEETQMTSSGRGTTSEPQSAIGDFFKGVDIPMLALGASILSSRGKGTMGALGEGVMAGLAADQQLKSAAQEGRQQEFENMLKLMTAESYRKQNELAARKASFDEEMFPLRKQQMEAEIEVLKSKVGTDPIKQQAIDDVAKLTQANPNAYSKEELLKMVQERYQQLKTIMDANGTGETALPNDPLGLFARQ